MNILFNILFFPIKFIGTAIKDGIYSGIVKIVGFITILAIIVYIFNGKL